jgi:chemotaxis signal transduction protein/chemotaxis methyl-accepting protein methylase
MDTSNMVNKQVTAEAIDIDQEKKEGLSVIDFKMITFSLAGKDYAIDIMKVKEIAKAGKFTYVPNALPFVVGVYNLRGDIIPIIDFRIFFNIEIAEHKSGELENLLIVSVGEQTFGVVVDEIDSVVGIEKSTIQPPHPLFGDINIKYIYGVVENNRHLYILLDIDRIFTSRLAEKKQNVSLVQRNVYVQAEKQLKDTAPVSKQKAADKTGVVISVSDKALPESSSDYRFVVEGLEALKKFYVTDVNEEWVKRRFDSWLKERGEKGSQLQSEEDADAFLKPFWSKNSDTWWTSEYADGVYKLLPDNTARQIIMWNPGCGKGYESYSLACLLKKRYPDSRVRIYAHDIDLLSVSNAPLLTMPESIANSWYAPYVTRKANGEYTFTQDIKDIVMFEYHDCSNTNVVPVVDIVFARDVISLMPKAAQISIFDDFEEKVKGNGIVIIGENESLAGHTEWGEKVIDSLVVYNKQ